MNRESMNKEGMNIEQDCNESELIQDEFLNEKVIDKEFNNHLLNYALHYAKIGYPVFPLHCLIKEKGILRCSCRDWKTCDRQGKHPRTRNGFKDATTNENQIIDWWESKPQSNIGLLTGIESGIFVLDVDVETGGEYSLDELQDIYRTDLKEFDQEYQSLPGTLTTITGSGGRHLYFKYPLDFQVNASASAIADGLDIRANGSYIVAPPSNHLSGRNYEWFGVNTPIEDAPDWLIYEVLVSSEYRSRLALTSPDVASPQPVKGEKIKKGGRNNHLFKKVCGLVNSYSEEEVLERAKKINIADFYEPLPEKDIGRMVKWAYSEYKISKSNHMRLRS